MRLRKVTSEKFYRIKQLGKITSATDVANSVGLSKATVTKIINYCEDYEDYLDSLKDVSERATRKIRDLHLDRLTGEPLFWAVHTDCRNFSITAIQRASGLSRGVIKAMKQTEDYEAYMKGEKEMPTNKTTSKGITKVAFYEIRKQLADGESIETISEVFGVDKRTVKKIAHYTSYPAFKRTRSRTCFWINDGVAKVIRMGAEKGLTIKEMQKELPYSRPAMHGILQGKPTNQRFISEEQYNKIREYPGTHKLGGSIAKSKDYMTWSLKKYARVKSVSWLTDTVEPTPAIVKAPEPYEKLKKRTEEALLEEEQERLEQEPVLTTADLGRAGASIEADLAKKNEPKFKVEDKKGNDLTDTIMMLGSIQAMQTSKNDTEKYKYRCILILGLMTLLCATGVAILALLK